MVTGVVTGGLKPAGYAQAPPATEVYLAPIRAGGTPPVGAWISISNDPDYDNQPSFLPDGSAVLFTSRRDGKQTDIYRYDIASRKLTQLTKTPESEYSPTVTPDGKTFSVIRVEADNTQRLWRFDLDGSNPRLVLENIKPVGYHAWIDSTHLALFVLGSPATLQIADTKTGQATVAVTGIGRSILVRPGRGTISYLATSETPRMLKEFDPRTGSTSSLIAPIDSSQDCAWMPDGRLLMAAAGGTEISVWTPGTNEWHGFFIFNADGVTPLAGRGATSATNEPAAVTPFPFRNITRLAVSPDGKWLAFVAEPASAK